jgi:hypothetical protein
MLILSLDPEADMKNRPVKVNGSAPKNPPKPEKVGGIKKAPMAGDKMRLTKTRGTGAAIKGTMHMGCC